MANIFCILSILFCISYAHEFPVCGPTEVLNRNPKPCTFDPTCAELINGTLIKCIKRPIFIRPRCDCRPGLVRIGQSCLPPQNCCTGPNEVLVSCPASCDDTCRRTFRPRTCRLTPCFRFGCKCINGYVRNETTRQCIFPRNCRVQFLLDEEDV